MSIAFATLGRIWPGKTCRTIYRDVLDVSADVDESVEIGVVVDCDVEISVVVETEKEITVLIDDSDSIISVVDDDEPEGCQND